MPERRTILRWQISFSTKGKLVAQPTNIFSETRYYAIMDVNEATAFPLEAIRGRLLSKGKVYYQEFDTPHPDGRIIPTAHLW